MLDIDGGKRESGPNGACVPEKKNRFREKHEISETKVGWLASLRGGLSWNFLGHVVSKGEDIRYLGTCFAYWAIRRR